MIQKFKDFNPESRRWSASYFPGAGPRLIFPVLVRVLFSDADFHCLSLTLVGARLPCFRQLRPVASIHFSEILSDINSTLITKNTQPPESSLHPGAGPRLIFPVLVHVLFSDADFHGLITALVGARLPCFRQLRPLASIHFSEILSDINSTLIPKNTQPPESSLHPGVGPGLIF